MFVLALRTLAAAAAAAAVTIACFWSSLFKDDSAVAFENVLRKVATAETLQLQVVRDGQTDPVFASRTNRLRWNHADGTYRIAHGDRLWQIDEQANRAALKPCAYFPADRPGLDLLALLELPAPADRKALLGARPTEQVVRDGLRCDVYRIEFPAPDGKIRLEALADADTQMLRSLEATADHNGRWQPIARLDVLAVDKPLPEDLFVVGDTLTEDGRVGKVTDVQGIVSVKPVMHSRFTPVDGRILLEPGDWLRTDRRGANAVALRLVKQTELTLGPGSLVEVVRPNRIRISSGTLKVTAEPKAPLEVVGPGGQKVKVAGTRLYRIDGQQLVDLTAQPVPLWLAGFEGTTNNESVGSLIANVDGQNKPLTIGHHKVTVTIRDQIALTEIDESFVNHTDSRTEGIFYFPLPQDASISGFASAIRACWNGPAATSSRPACSRSLPTPESGSRSRTPRSCRLRGTATVTATPCRARCSRRTRWRSWRSTYVSIRRRRWPRSPRRRTWRGSIAPRIPRTSSSPPRSTRPIAISRSSSRWTAGSRTW